MKKRFFNKKAPMLEKNVFASLDAFRETYSRKKEEALAYLKELGCDDKELIRQIREEENRYKGRTKRSELLRETVILANIPLAFRMATDCLARWASFNLDPADCVQHAVLGLVKAMDDFDLEKGAKIRFGNYAVFKIKDSLNRFVQHGASCISVSPTAYTGMKILKEKGETEKAEQVNALLARAGRIRNRHLGDKEWLEETITEDDNLSCTDLADADSTFAADSEAHPRSRSDWRDSDAIAEEGDNIVSQKYLVHYVLKKELTKDEYTVITEFFGFNGEKPKSLRRIMDDHNLHGISTKKLIDSASQKLKNNQLLKKWAVFSGFNIEDSSENPKNKFSA